MVDQLVKPRKVPGYHDYPDGLDDRSDNISSSISTSILRKKWSELSSTLFSDEIRLRVYDFGEKEGDRWPMTSLIVTGG